ncbi:hypothetical protein E2C01_059673 [Portunus trituberculatus]|uniref:Uncharacterized protein n=1 Tax=Portunus trituberculatus TaxID=210409 RepID=A0A5B7H6I2_PORTR|nr:hypothetical protein [Portunus trituberculatus]
MTVVGSGKWKDSSRNLAGTGGRTASRRVFCLSNVLSSGERAGSRRELSQQRLVLRRESRQQKRAVSATSCPQERKQAAEESCLSNVLSSRKN